MSRELLPDGMTLEKLLRDARADIRRTAIALQVLGGALLALGLFGIAILVAAAPLADLLGVGAVLTIVAVLPGAALFARGRRPVDRHPLVVALSAGADGVRGVSISYQQNLRGYSKMATISLTNGATYSIVTGGE